MLCLSKHLSSKVEYLPFIVHNKERMHQKSYISATTWELRSFTLPSIVQFHVMSNSVLYKTLYNSHLHTPLQWFVLQPRLLQSHSTVVSGTLHVYQMVGAPKWPTCMMTSRMRAGVKVPQLAIENVWGIPNAC